MSLPEKLIIDKETNEVLNMRELCSKTFWNGNEKKPEFTLKAKTGAIHYEDKNGELQNMDFSIKRNRVHKCNYDVRLYKDKIGYTGTDPDGKKIELELELPYVKPIIKGNKAIYRNVCRNTDFELVFHGKMIRANRIIKGKSAKKSVTFRSFREEGAKGRLLNVGWDACGKETQLDIKEKPTLIEGETRYVQKWEGTVRKQDPVTRKSTWSKEDIAYPVTIDPTSTFVIAANADDGRGQGNFFSTPFNGTIDNAAGQFSVRRFAYLHVGTWLRFTGITIAQGSTINSATLKVYGCGNKNAGSLPIKFVADKASAPGNPTLYPQVTSPTSVTGAVTVTLPNPTPYYANTNVAAYQLVNVTVTSHVQALVNLYAYSSGEIVFYGNVPSEDAYPKFRYIYQRDTGTTKDAELTINWSPGDPVAVAKTVFVYP